MGGCSARTVQGITEEIAPNFLGLLLSACSLLCSLLGSWRALLLLHVPRWTCRLRLLLLHQFCCGRSLHVLASRSVWLTRCFGWLHLRKICPDHLPCNIKDP